VVIDTAGAATQATIFAIGCADVVLVPVKRPVPTLWKQSKP